MYVTSKVTIVTIFLSGETSMNNPSGKLFAIFTIHFIVEI